MSVGNGGSVDDKANDWDARVGLGLRAAVLRMKKNPQIKQHLNIVFITILYRKA